MEIYFNLLIELSPRITHNAQLLLNPVVPGVH